METVPTHDSIRRVAPELKARGVRLVPGGDYGFPFNPTGRNARDLRLFVEWFGMTPAEALRCATQYGGELMDMEVGLVREGYLADLLLVEGDPLADISLLEDPANLSMIMKDGRFHQLSPDRRADRRAARLAGPCRPAAPSRRARVRGGAPRRGLERPQARPLPRRDPARRVGRGGGGRRPVRPR